MGRLGEVMMREESPIRVLLVDLDHAITTQISGALSAESAVRIVALASNADFGLHQVLAYRPDVIIAAKTNGACNLMYELRLLLTYRFAPRAIFVAAAGTGQFPSSCTCGMGCSVLPLEDVESNLVSELYRLCAPDREISQRPLVAIAHQAAAGGWAGAA